MRPGVILYSNAENGLPGTLEDTFSRHGLGVQRAPDEETVVKTSYAGEAKLIIIGPLHECAANGLDLVHKIRQWDSTVPVILISGQSCEEAVIAALRAGVDDYFKTPVPIHELIASVLRRIPAVLQKASHDKPLAIIGISPAICELRSRLLKIAAVDSNALVTGETGTGKDLVAQLIHRNSLRRSKPFICFNCAAIPETLVESEMFGFEKGAFTGASVSRKGKFLCGEGGTVLLDEIGEMSLSAQSKLLRAVEAKEVHQLGGTKSIPLDVRIIAATNRDPEQLVCEGTFRSDLFYRLSVARLHIPPLRERKEDIPLLLEHFMNELNGRFFLKAEGFTKEAMTRLVEYDWPGNVRELRNVLESTFIDFPGGMIGFENLPDHFKKRFGQPEGCCQNERDRILSTLLATKWNKSKTAEQLHWSRMTLYRKMRKYRLARSPHPKSDQTP